MDKKHTFYKIPRTLTVDSLYTCFVRYKEGDYRFAGEMHDFWEFTYVVEGSASVANDDSVYVLNKGELLFHRPMEFHRNWGNGKPLALLVMSFQARGDVMEALADKVFTIDLMGHNTLFDIKREIEETYDMRGITLYSDGESPLALNSIALKLELFMLDLIRQGASEKKAENSASSKEFSKIVSVMNSNLHRDLSVEEIADIVNIGVSNMKKICHKYIGVGPAKHFLRLKIARAIQLLEDGQNVTEVSEALGFSTQSYFSVVFKRETGMSPSKVKGSKHTLFYK
ncbi:MAG: helix-turn-helix transcriptional regulator [Clostridia bacterium]|nr:helix-turn-helix transcriptional regulator [Clostridia bacterium]